MHEGLVSRSEAIARLTWRAADRLGLGDRGRIQAGRRADLVLLDHAAFTDTATYDKPCQTPPGVRRVLVAGTTVIEDGVHTGARPGHVLRSARGCALPPVHASPF